MTTNLAQKKFHILTSDETVFGSPIYIQKEDKKFCIYASRDNDIWFETREDSLVFDLDFSSRERAEWLTFGLFNNLMKAIVGRYILNGDNEIHTTLPEDFVDLESKTITWHSDSGVDNILKIQYLGDIIRISIIKAPKEHSFNKIRIRTDGSSYERYHQEFTLFYRQLLSLAYQFNEKKTNEENIIKPAQTPDSCTKSKKLKLPKFFPKQRQ